jgi:hypothetical protein
VAKKILALVIFGVAFGYVEAAVVVYLRTIDAPLRRALLGDMAHDAVLPLLRWDQLSAAGPEYVLALRTELGRELATLVMLAAVGMTIGKSFREWLAGFSIVFGVWDVSYYGFLHVLVGWPISPWTWDILFLLPVPWTAPVIAPLVIALTMIIAGSLTLWRESRGRPVHGSSWEVTSIFAGGLLVVIAFCWDFRQVAAGGWPPPFNWPLFVLGEALSIAAFAHALRRKIRVKILENNIPK